MKNTCKVFGIIALVAIIGFSFATLSLTGCGGGGGGGGGGEDPNLSGKISINQSGSINIETELTATYDGPENVTFQWKKDGKVITGKTSEQFTPTEAGSYTVTVSAKGYKSKTSAAVNVIDSSLETVATPTALPAAGTYTTAQNVTLTTTTTGAKIYYTTNGTDPTTTSTLYASAISISATTTLKAIAVKEGMNNSGILTALYTINSSSGGGGNPAWPTEFGGATQTGTDWGKTSYPNPCCINFYTWPGSTGNGGGPFMNFSGSSDGYTLVSVSNNGQTLKVKAYGSGPEITLCTSWTITNDYLTLSGGDSLFSTIMNKPLGKNGSGVGSGGGGSGGGGNMTWTAVTDSTFGTNNIETIAYGNGTFVAGGLNGKMATSTDGTAWTAVMYSMFGTYYTIWAIAYGNGTFVAGGSSGKMAYSTDGVEWTAVPNTTFTSNIYAIAYGNGTFVAGDYNGKMATSTDGTAWTAVTNSTFGTTQISAIAYGNGTFVAGGYNGKMAYSTDGVEWTAVTDSAFGTTQISAIAYGNNMFVACGWDSKMATSSDGINWTAVTNSTNTIFAIAYGNGKFVSGGGATSSDGINWTAVTNSALLSSIYAIAYGNGTFVAGGYSGKMAYSTDN